MEIPYDYVDIPFDLILYVASFLKIPVLDKIKKIYYELDDKPNIFKELRNNNICDIGDNYICYNRTGEYGNTMKICDLYGVCMYELFVSSSIDDTYDTYITTFYNNITQKGISEKIL